MQQKEKVKRNQNYQDILFSKGGGCLPQYKLSCWHGNTYIYCREINDARARFEITHRKSVFRTPIHHIGTASYREKMFFGSFSRSQSCQIRFDINSYIISSSCHTYVHSNLTLLKSSLKHKFRFTPQTKDFNSTREITLINGVTGSARDVSIKISVL